MTIVEHFGATTLSLVTLIINGLIATFSINDICHNVMLGIVLL
jgi:hypothetical protein